MILGDLQSTLFSIATGYILQYASLKLYILFSLKDYITISYSFSIRLRSNWDYISMVTAVVRWAPYSFMLSTATSFRITAFIARL